MAQSDVRPGGTCPPWGGDDADERTNPAFQQGLWDACVSAARTCQTRHLEPDDLRSWHEQAFRAVVPLGYYAGNFRGADVARFPCLWAGVGVGGLEGSPPQFVEGDIADLLDQVREFLSLVEVSNQRPHESAKQLAMVIGTAVGRFVQVHPFMNGNGRTSRILWRALLARFGLPPHVGVLRRPAEDRYSKVMRSAMRGDFGPAVEMVLDALLERLPSISER